jgi:hypothetical protein
MNLKVCFFISYSLISWHLSAQYREVRTETFQNKDNLTDLSELLIWGSNSDAESAFATGPKSDIHDLEYQSIYLTNHAIGMGGYNSGSTYTSTAFDLMFEPLSHLTDVVSVEFDYLSAQLSGNGESGRLGVALLTDYPEQGPQFDDVYNAEDVAPFGRPAYNLRLLNGTGTTKQAYLFYGGGKDVDGEFERTGDQVWLPGFISGPGGTSPGSLPDYPIGPVKICNKSVVSASEWMRYTWLVYPEKMEVYRRKCGTDSIQNELLMSMSIPNTNQTVNDIMTKMSLFHGVFVEQLPTLYNWFDGFVGVRFYFRSVQNGYLANARISTTEKSTNVHNSKQQQSLWDGAKVFPTQVYDVLNIRTAGRQMRCDILSLTGQIELSQLVGDGQLGLYHLIPGMYVVQLRDVITGEVKHFKIMKK